MLRFAKSCQMQARMILVVLSRTRAIGARLMPRIVSVAVGVESYVVYALKGGDSGEGEYVGGIGSEGAGGFFMTAEARRSVERFRNTARHLGHCCLAVGERIARDRCYNVKPQTAFSVASSCVLG